MTTIGVWQLAVLVMQPIALPVPEAACRLRKPVVSDAWAKPSAIAIAAPSWRAR